MGAGKVVGVGKKIPARRRRRRAAFAVAASKSGVISPGSYRENPPRCNFSRQGVTAAGCFFVFPLFLARCRRVAGPVRAAAAAVADKALNDGAVFENYNAAQFGKPFRGSCLMKFRTIFTKENRAENFLERSCL